MQKTVTSPDKREMSVQIRLPSGIAQSVECQKFLFLNFSVCYTNQRAAVQETVTSLVTPDVVGSSPTPLWDSSVGRTPLCLFLDFSARFFKKIMCALQNCSYFEWSPFGENCCFLWQFGQVRVLRPYSIRFYHALFL